VTLTTHLHQPPRLKKEYRCNSTLKYNVKVKVKLSRYRLAVDQSVPDYVTTAQDGGKVISFTYRPPLPPGNVPDIYVRG
jgi:hypothetical protein